MNYLTVDIYQDFHCIADSCPNTCCIGWEIIVDKNTYEKMIQKEEELGIPAKDWLVDNNGTIVVKKKNGKCPALSEEGLCKVVTKLGPQYLCTTCTMYPRTSKQYGDVLEGYLYMSCPEVVSMLIEKETIEFDMGKDNKLQKEDTDYAYIDLYLFESTARTSIVELLQSMPHISLNTRLFAAFTILEEAVRMYGGHQFNADIFRAEVNAYIQEPILSALEKQLKNAVDEKKRYYFLKEIINIAIDNKRPEYFTELVQQSVDYFNQEYSEQYLSDLQAFKEYSLAVYSNFYTNYWVYRIFSDILSIPEYEKSKKKFVYIAIEFALFQIITLASFVKKGRIIDEKEYIYIISSLSRMMEHNESFRKKLTFQMDKNNLVSAAGVLLLSVV